MLFEMLAGRVPWEGDNPLAVMGQHVNAPLPSLRDDRPDDPGAARGDRPKCLRKNPDERYADAGELHADLERWQDLDVSAFHFGEDAVKRSSARRGLPLLVRGSASGSSAASALFVVLFYLLQHAG